MFKRGCAFLLAMFDVGVHEEFVKTVVKRAEILGFLERALRFFPAFVEPTSAELKFAAQGIALQGDPAAYLTACEERSVLPYTVAKLHAVPTGIAADSYDGIRARLPDGADKVRIGKIMLRGGSPHVLELHMGFFFSQMKTALEQLGEQEYVLNSLRLMLPGQSSNKQLLVELTPEHGKGPYCSFPCPDDLHERIRKSVTDWYGRLQIL